MPRLFTGLEIPSDVSQSLSMLRGGLPGARWIDPENYHVTLRFIGDVDDVIAHEVASMLGRVRREAFELRIEDLKSFGGRKPRQIVATLGPAQALMELQAEHERLMQRVGLEPEGRKYTPHVSLARLRESSSRQVADYLALRAPFRSPPFKVSRFVLFSSRAAVGGGPYVGVTRGPSSAAADHTGFNSLDCTSKMAVAKPWLSASISRISESGVGRGVATSPTTLEKSKVSSASYLRASCCMRLLSARQAMCRNLRPRLRAASSVRSSSMEPTPWLCHGFSIENAASASRVTAPPIGRSSAVPRSVPSMKKP
jgi:RNA 2',3'-cyclic 3'-phosphodiesterase